MRGELVEKFESYDAAAEHLAVEAALALAPDHERTAALAADAATKEALSRVAAETMDPASAVLIVVGPSAKIEGSLYALGYRDIEVRDTDGNVVKGKGSPSPH
jgi:hypothetical protein